MHKREALEHWAGLESGQNPLGVMQAIPYKTSGRSYGTDGIRIDGSPEFVDAVLSNLKGLIDGENQVTRLALSRNPANTDFKANPNAAPGAEVVYIRLHQRGREGVMAATVFDRHLEAATDRFMAGRE